MMQYYPERNIEDDSLTTESHLFRADLYLGGYCSTNKEAMKDLELISLLLTSLVFAKTFESFSESGERIFSSCVKKDGGIGYVFVDISSSYYGCECPCVGERFINSINSTIAEINKRSASVYKFPCMLLCDWEITEEVYES